MASLLTSMIIQRLNENVTHSSKNQIRPSHHNTEMRMDWKARRGDRMRTKREEEWTEGEVDGRKGGLDEPQTIFNLNMQKHIFKCA